MAAVLTKRIFRAVEGAISAEYRASPLLFSDVVAGGGLPCGKKGVSGTSS